MTQQSELPKAILFDVFYSFSLEKKALETNVEAILFGLMSFFLSLDERAQETNVEAILSGWMSFFFLS